MVNFKKNVLRVLTLILVALVAVTFTSMTVRPVNADEEVAFSLTQGASIRNCSDEENPVYGMKFETKVSTSWLNANPADKYNFGTLIFPAYVEDASGNLTVDNFAKFNRESDVSVNKSNLDAIKFIVKNGEAVSEGFTMNSTITYTEQEVSNYLKTLKDSYTDEELQAEVKKTLKRAYKREFTAISYAELYVEESDTWTTVYSTDTYTDSMEKVAMRLINDATWGEVAKQYLPAGAATQITNVDGYVVNGNGVVEVNDFSTEVHSVDFDATGLTNFVLGNKTLVQDVDYTINGTSLDLTDSVVEGLLGSYENLYAYDNQNNLTVVKILFAHEELTTAEQVKAAFDLTGAYINWLTSIKGGTPESNYKAYVLGNNIDMTGVKIDNLYRTDISVTVDTYFDYNTDGVYELDPTTLNANLGYGGIFDGRGYSISNAVAGTDSSSAYFNYKKDEAGTAAAKYSLARNGFFGRLLLGAEVKNVAFINLNGTGSENASYPITGPLAYSSEGLLENVYIDINPACWTVRGPIANPGYNAEYKNVVINWQMENYDFVSHLATEKNSRYAYAYGSLFGGNAAAPVGEIGFDNVIVTSQIPVIAFKNGTTPYVGGINNIYYGENEETIIYNFNGEVTQNTVQEAIDAKSARVNRVNNVLRYDNSAQLVADANSANNVKALTDTGLFKVVEGQLIWNTEKVNLVIEDAIDYDAKLGQFMTSDFENKDIQKIVVTVGGVEYELTDGAGYTKTNTDGVYTYAFAQKASSSDATVGMPYVDKKVTGSQVLKVVLHTEIAIYTYDNVNYWTMIINDATELKTALDINYTTNAYNYGYYKLGNDITVDSAGLGYSYTGFANKVTGNSSEAGFNGEFDGCGHTIDMNTTGVTNGLFGSFQWGGSSRVVNPTIKNFRIINWALNGAPVLAKYASGHTYWGTAPFIHIENVYIDWANNGGLASGLITYPAGVVMKNVYVETVGTNQDSYNISAAYGEIAGKAYYNSNAFYKGGALFTSLAYLNSSMSTFDNVVTVGKNPLTFQPVHSWWRRNAVKHTANNDGTYTHSLGYTAFDQNYNEYYAYPGNFAKGDIAVRKSIKENFLDLVANNDGSAALAGAYCATCYNQFSLDNSGAATCPDCGVKMKTVAATDGSDMWCQPAIYNWGVEDLTTFENTLTSAGGAVKLNGTYKYNTVADMKTSGNSFESFLGEDGNKLWKLSPDGQLVWYTTKLTYTNDEYIDYGADEGVIYSDLINDIEEDITSIVANGNTLTVGNGIIVNDDGSISLTALAKGSAETNGVPYMDTNKNASNVFTITVYTSGDTYVFNNVHYQTMMISNPTELKAALDIDYTVNVNNFGFYKLDNDIKYTEAMPFNYTGAGSSIKDISSGAGFVGQFDGDGHTINFNNTWIGTNGKYYGLFGNVNHSGGIVIQAPITIKNFAITNVQAGGVPSLSLFGKYSKNHTTNSSPVVIENIYVNSMGDVPAGIFMQAGNQVKYNNVFIDMRKGNSLGAYYGGIFSNDLRRGAATMANNVTNFVTLGNPKHTNLVKTNVDAVSNKWVKSTLNDDGQTYTHTIYHGGWSGHSLAAERYFGYAGGNRTHGNVVLVQGFKPMFAEINVKYNKSTAIPGAYCANCGEYFTEDTTIANCPTCVVDDAPVALTVSSNLWDVTAAYVTGYTELSTVDPAKCSAGTDGELVFWGAYQYDSTTEMSDAYTADSSIFDSFLGEDGEGCWTVSGGILTWQGKVTA